MSELYLIPLMQDEARAWVDAHHRHLGAPVGDIIRVGLARDGEVVGCAMAGRPSARLLNDGWTLEVTRNCVIEGVPNGCSMLYGAIWRAAKALGWRRMVTYTLPSESGASLKASGWKVVAKLTGGGSWSRKSRPRVDTHPQQQKIRWEAPT